MDQRKAGRDREGRMISQSNVFLSGILCFFEKDTCVNIYIRKAFLYRLSCVDEVFQWEDEEGV